MKPFFLHFYVPVSSTVPPTRPHASRVIHPHHLAITSSASVTSYNNHRVSQRQLAHPPTAPHPLSPFPPIVLAARPLLPLSTRVYLLTRGPATLRTDTPGLKASLDSFIFVHLVGV